MLTLAQQSYVGWQISLGLFQGIALGSCGFRLVHRFKARRGWWDDYVLLVPFVLDFLFVVLYFVRFHTRVNPSLPPTNLDRILQSYWLTDLLLMSITWSTKFVLCLSLVRILPRRTAAWRYSLALAGVTILSWIACAIISAATCKQDTLIFSTQQGGNCLRVGKFPFKRIFFETNNLVATFSLTLVCLMIYTRKDVSPAVGRFVLSVFGASLCIFILAALVVSISLNKDVLLGPDEYMLLSSLEQTEAANSLLMANLSILISAFRLLLGSSAHEVAIENDILNDDSSSHAGSASHSCTERSVTPLTLTEISESIYSRSSIISGRSRFSVDTPHVKSLASLKIEPLESC